ncbi:MAG: putative toxin-antitoxin system toxin component, PIN family [Spirochaetaceae bacterium]
MIVVLDTNLWISLLLGKRVANLRRHLYEPAVQVITSAEQRQELVDTLYRPKLQKVLTESHRQDLIGLFSDTAQEIAVDRYVQASRDPKDDFILSLAVSGNADLIVTGDKDLLSLHPFHNIDIISYGDFEKRLGTD